MTIFKKWSVFYLTLQNGSLIVYIVLFRTLERVFEKAFLVLNCFCLFNSVYV